MALDTSCFSCHNLILSRRTRADTRGCILPDSKAVRSMDHPLLPQSSKLRVKSHRSRDTSRRDCKDSSKTQPPFVLPSHQDREEKRQVMVVWALHQPRSQKTPRVTVRTQAVKRKRSDQLLPTIQWRSTVVCCA